MLQCIETEGEVGGAEILLETLSARDLEIHTLNITILWNEGAESVRAYIYGHMALERSQFWSYFHAQQSKRKCRCKNLSDHSHLRPTWYSHLIFTNKDFK